MYDCYIGTDTTGTAVGAGNTGDGVVITGAGNTIDGAVISGNGGRGVYLTGNGNLIQGNIIGLGADGETPLGNGGIGILLSGSSSSNTIGAGNVISGNAGSGVNLSGSGVTGNAILGDLIGTDATGEIAKPNAGDGIVFSSAPANTIGGTGSGAANVISGNAGNGITITGDSATGNLVSVNLIGTDKAGMAAIGNGNDGVYISSSENTIGAWDGTSSGDGAPTVISGNKNAGIDLAGDYNDVVNCYVGADITGMGGIGNGADGIDAEGEGDDIGLCFAPPDPMPPPTVIIDSVGTGVSLTNEAKKTVSNCYIGVAKDGTTPKGNQGDGVVIFGVTAKDNTVSGNVISANKSDGVDISNGAQSNKVLSNIIGLGKDGSTDQGLSNGEAGVLIMGASSNQIGAAGAGNTISNNSGPGVQIVGNQITGASTKNIVQANAIGTDSRGIVKRPNTGSGVLISGGDNTTIGGSFQAGQGNVISGNEGDGITINQLSNGTIIQGNYIGTDSSGEDPLANEANGIKVAQSGKVTIGGASFDAGNVISGNGMSGIYFAADSSPSLVQSNIIGADESVIFPVPNQTSGITIAGSNNTIGGNWNSTGNIISGNNGDGIIISGTKNSVLGNCIGTDLNGTSTFLYNSGNGITVSSANNTIGGSGMAGNLISGNEGNGVYLTLDAAGDLLQGNYIGTNAVGTSKRGNGGAGVWVQGAGNTIGGPLAGDGVLGTGNIISGNAADGILIDGNAASGNIILGNYIGVGKDGVTPLGNSDNGINLLNGASGNHIGGINAADGNVISGNGSGAGALLDNGVTVGNSCDLNALCNNFIGTDWSGLLAVGNWGDGVYIHPSAGNGNSIGGAAGIGNLISGNGNAAAPATMGRGIDFNNVIITEDWNAIGVDVNGAGGADIKNKNGAVTNAPTGLPGAHDALQN